MTTWEEFRYRYGGSELPNAIKTNIKCPRCGEPIYMGTNILLTTYSVQYSYFCGCGWAGHSQRRWALETEE